MFCSRCSGTGQIYGNGMIIVDCKPCDGTGKLDESKKPSMKIIDKKSQSYKDAIKDIMALNPKITKTEAAKMFEEAFDKV